MKRSHFLTALIVFSYLYIAARPATDSVAGNAAPGESTDVVANDTIDDGDYTDLEDFVIVTQKKLVVSDGAKLTYNVSEDPESGSSNILDILRKVPGVSVDADDNVKVKGQSNFKILVNGREDPMLKGDIKTVLKAMPANSIKKIEVISEPGAKYDSEGIGGILNIITDNSRTLSGFMTQLSGWVNSYQVGGSVNGKVKLNKVLLDATVGYNNGRAWPRYMESTGLTTTGTGSDTQILKEHSRGKSGWDYTGARLNMSWEPDSLNLFNLSANYGYNTWDSDFKGYRRLQGADGIYIWDCTRNTMSDGLYHGFSVSASYQHNFGRDDNNLILSYEYDLDKSSNNNDVITDYILGQHDVDPYLRSDSRSHNDGHIIQLDYMNQFNGMHLLEAGLKTNISPSSLKSETLSGSDKDDAVVDDPSTVDARQFKDIYAVYASYTGSFSKWNFKAGLRYELTRMGMNYKIGDYEDFTTYLHDVVPNAAVSYNFSDASSIRAAYQMRISRPGIQLLNPYVNTLYPGQITYGNPDLKSIKMHNMSLGYSNYEGKFSGEVKLNYRFTDNSINDIMFFSDGLIHCTYANVGSSHNVSLDLTGSWNITQTFSWSLYLSGAYDYMKADSELLHAVNKGWQGNFQSNINYTLPCKLRLSGWGGYWTPWRDIQSKGSDGYYYGLGISRSFLKEDALSLSLTANTFLPRKRTHQYTQRSENLVFVNKNTYSQWNVGLSISWRFGGLKASVKKTAASIEKEESVSAASGKSN
ncbi:MAG: TonB-dependent receptor [Muribaculaceae bacterium]|nr:TonB-dependent receptor [Muribaculaceae bacterium]